MNKPRYFLAIAVAGIMLPGSLTFAQPAEEITIVAPHEVARKQVGWGYLGGPIEEVTITHKVAYKDLDLKTDAGVASLQSRIKTVAKHACHELDELYPKSREENLGCQKSAIKSAKAQLDAIVADAKK